RGRGRGCRRRGLASRTRASHRHRSSTSLSQFQDITYRRWSWRSASASTKLIGTHKETSMTRIAVIGTGNVGGNLGARLSNAGFPVRFGVRDDKDTPALLAKCAKDASTASPAAAAEWAEVVFLAVPAPAAAELARSLPLAGKVVVDATNPLTWQ